MTGEPTRADGEAPDASETAPTAAEALVRAYYEALDDHDYERLASLLVADFRHDRPDMTIDGRDEFVAFMRENRPVSETSHPIETVYHGDGGTVAVQGRLVDRNGDVLTGFVDLFSLDGERIAEIRTYTDR